MRILHVSSKCGHGGVETVLATLAREQISCGIEAEIFFFQDCGGAEHYRDICPITFAEQMSLTELLLRKQFDLIHCVAGSIHLVDFAVRRSCYGGPVIVTCHGVFHGSGKAVVTTAVSHSTARRIKSLASGSIRVIYNGVDTNIFYPLADEGNEKPIVAWVGRAIDPDKDFCGLVAVANSGRISNFQFIVIDGSPEDSHIDQWLPAGTAVFSRVPWRQMADFYRRVRASRGFLLSTSRTEACPMNVLEAQACGCPVIVPNLGGLPEVVQHKETGYVYDKSGGVEAVAEAVQWLYNEADYAAVSSKASEWLKEHFSARRMCQDYNDLYVEVLANHHMSRAHRLARPACKMLMCGLKAARGMSSYLKGRKKHG